MEKCMSCDIKFSKMWNNFAFIYGETKPATNIIWSRDISQMIKFLIQ